MPITQSLSPAVFVILSWLQVECGELPRFTPERLHTTRPRPSVMNGGSCCRVSEPSPGRGSLAGNWALAIVPTSGTGGASNARA